MTLCWLTLISCGGGKRTIVFINGLENAGRENPKKNPCPDSAEHVPDPHRKNPGTVRVRVAMSDMRVGPGQPQTRTRPGLLPSLPWDYYTHDLF